jgi:pyrroline-5-carboxylate reductase
MSTSVHIGIIGGNGWLGNAIASAAVAAEVVEPSRLTLSSRSEKRGAFDIPGAR